MKQENQSKTDSIRALNIKCTPIMWIVIFTITIIGITIYSSFTGRSMAKRYASPINASMKIKLEVTPEHLWYEEIISEDPTLRLEISVNI
jgi:hypothetical protein